MKTADLSEVFSLDPRQPFLPLGGANIERSAWMPLNGDAFDIHHFDDVLKAFADEELARMDSLDLQTGRAVQHDAVVADALQDQAVEHDGYSTILNAMLEPLYPLFTASTDASTNERKRSLDEVD